MVEKIELSNGTIVDFDKKNPRTLFEIIISEILIPKYKESDDWNLAINIIIEETNQLIKKNNLSPDLKLGLLNQVEEHLDKDIEELTGVAKIEILFLNMDDYVEEIKIIMTAGLDKTELRNQMARLIQPLTVFELGELFIFLAKRTFLK
ncbi:MAG: hypothetical protein KGD63_10545 [Candidatus Lokiarchaeota archaeon]|nr:hypothetical protein [Candidatus Lokiarchaeota archaeon]